MALTERIAAGEYGLFIQKQAGADAHPLALDITMPTNIDAYEPPDVLEKESNNRVIGTWDAGI